MKKETLKMLIAVLILSLFFLMASLSNRNDSTNSEKFSEEKFLDSVRKNDERPFEVLKNQAEFVMRKGGIDSAIRVSELALKNRDISIDECHVLLHQIGHISYSIYPGDLKRFAGKKSAICVGSYQHGVEAEIALASKNSIADLKRYCKILRGLNIETSCYHGAGHAFFQKNRDVFKALKQCDYLKEEGYDLQNCYTGVFSEYGNQALGFDGDTGLAVKGKPRIKLDLNNPYQFCTDLDERYKNACYTQLTKIFIKPVDPVGSLEKCLQAIFEEQVQATCMRIVSGVLARDVYSSQEVVKPPSIILSSTPLLRKAYIQGVHEGFISFRSSGIQKDWKKECELFPLDVDVSYCLSLE